MSQEALAEKLDLSKEYICRVERGQKYMSLRKLFQLCDALDVDFCKLTNFKLAIEKLLNSTFYS